MIRKLLLVVLLGMCSSYAALAQDPAASGVVISPSPIIQTGAPGSITVSFGNGSSAPIAQGAAATYVIAIPANFGVVSSTISTPTGSTNTTGNLVPVTSIYSSTTGTTITIRSTNGPVPGNAVYDLVVSILGVAPGGGTVNADASATGVTATNVTLNDHADAQYLVQGPQPVSLVSFTARAKDDHIVGLAWTTSLETNNKGFFIERSKDLKAFEKVGEITEVGANSNALKNYTLTDFTPYMGTSYYRLTQVDLDGKATVYQDKVVSVVLRDGAYGVFPNPVINDQQFRLSLDEPETAQINFYGADGRSMPLQKVGIESGNVLLKVTGKLSTGVYILTVGERGQTRKHRLVVE